MVTARTRGQTYENFVNRARLYINQGEANRIALLRWLVEWEPRRLIWIHNPHQATTWEELIEAEHFCSRSVYRGFRMAAEQEIPIEDLGVYASSNIARISDERRRRLILNRTVRWHARAAQTPTYQLINRFVCEQRRDLGDPSTTTTPTKTQLRAELRAAHEQAAQLQAGLEAEQRYTQRLQEIIRRHKHRVPRRGE